MTKNAGRHRSPRRAVVPATGPGAGTRRSTLLIVVAAVMVGIGRLIGPGPSGSPGRLVAVLLLVACGVGVAVAGTRFGVRAVRAGRDMATAPLVIGGFLALWGVVVFVGTVGRFVGWH